MLLKANITIPYLYEMFLDFAHLFSGLFGLTDLPKGILLAPHHLPCEKPPC